MGGQLAGAHGQQKEDFWVNRDLPPSQTFHILPGAQGEPGFGVLQLGHHGGGSGCLRYWRISATSSPMKNADSSTM